MNVKPIRTEADYEEALVRVGYLIDAKIGTPEGDELDLLATLIDQYEEAHFVIDAPTPVAAIKFRMEQEGLSARDLEPYIGSRARVSEVLSGARPLSIEMIRALNVHMGIPAEPLLRRQPETKSTQPVEPSKAISNLLVKLEFKSKKETYSDFLFRACGTTPALAMLRKSRTERTKAQTDSSALQAWCASVMLRSEGCKISGRFDAKAIDFKFVREIAALSKNDQGPSRVASELANLGIAFVVLEHFPGTHLDGAAMMREDGVPILAMTLRHDRIDNFWFTLLHELAHIKNHLVDTWVIYDDLDLKSTEQLEKEADELAQTALIPQGYWERWNLGEYTSIAQIEKCAREADVNPAIVAGRWQRQHHDFRKFSKMLGRGTIKPQFQ